MDSSGRGHDQFDWAALADHLSSWDDVEQDRHREILGWLGVAPGAAVADIGSGAGGMAAAMVQAVGPAGTVVIIDGDEKLLEVARRRATRPGHHLKALCADLETASLSALVERPCDVVHAAGVIHHVDDQVAAVVNLASIVRPGGKIALGEGGLDTRFLPAECWVGTPGLEPRLAAAQDAWFWDHVRPVGVTTAMGGGWGDVLRAAGCVVVTARSFLLDMPAPLDTATRRLVSASLAGKLERFGDRLDAGDRAALAVLVDDSHPGGVLQHEGAFVLGVRTVHVGTVRG